MGKPFSNIKNLVIGIVLMIIPIVNILTIPGYMLRVAKKTMSGDNSLPGFGNFGELVVDSIKAIVVGIVYGIIITIVLFILMLIPYGIGAVLGFIWYIVAIFMLLSAMMTLARTGSIGAALGVPSVLKRVANGGFIASVIVGAIIADIIAAIVMVIVILIFAASMLPVFLSGTIPDAAALMGMISGLGIGMVIMLVVAYILVVFFYSLVAGSYPDGAAPARAAKAASGKMA